MATEHTRKIHIIIVAAGIGSRFRQSEDQAHADSLPKQYELIGNQPVLVHSIQAFDAIDTDSAELAGITLVLNPADQHWESISKIPYKHPIHTTTGGSQRHDSVRNGIQSIKSRHKDWAKDWVLVHDAARPCVTTTEINQLIKTCLDAGQGGLLVKPLSDTIKLSEDGQHVSKTVDRSALYAALTPQMFNGKDLLKALTVFEADSITDESSAVEAQGQTPLMVMGQSTNIKITRYEDLLLAEKILEQQGRLE